MAHARLSAKLRAETEKRGKRYARFSINVSSGVWPADKCKYCVQSTEQWLTCCERHKGRGHQPMDCCDHCGSDFRNPYLWTYRGKRLNE